MPTPTIYHRRSPSERSAETLQVELDVLVSLSKEDLKARWGELYGSSCPPHISRMLLTHAIAYRIQERALGGLDRATRRRRERSNPAPGSSVNGKVACTR
jgi:hypothetical protein